MFAISNRSLDPISLTENVKDVSAGGFVSFEGWVRNRLGGSVEVVFAGPSEAVAAMREACWQGPPNARVRGIEDLAEVPEVPPGAGFHQARTL